MKYKYHAMNSNGQDTKGEVEAMDTEEAIRKIRALGLFPTRILKEGEKETPSAISEVVKMCNDYHSKKPLTQREERLCIGLALSIAINIVILIILIKY